MFGTKINTTNLYFVTTFGKHFDHCAIYGITTQETNDGTVISIFYDNSYCIGNKKCTTFMTTIISSTCHNNVTTNVFVIQYIFFHTNDTCFGINFKGISIISISCFFVGDWYHRFKRICQLTRQ